MSKEQLKQLWDLRKELTQLEEIIDRLKAELESPRTSQYWEQPGRKSGSDQDLLLKQVAKVLDLKAVYDQKRVELYDSWYEIENAFTILESRERRLLRYRYIQGLNWEKICDEMGYCWRQVHRIHNLALKRLQGS